MPFTIMSPAFKNGGHIPMKYTRDGQNVSPPLEWRDTPPETRSFVLIVEDPDAPSGTFGHWAIYNIPAARTGLPEGAPNAELGAVKQAVNGFRHTHYDGPQPPKGHGLHHYHFRLAALDMPQLDLSTQASVEQVWKAAQPHIIAEAELVGIYER